MGGVKLVCNASDQKKNSADSCFLCHKLAENIDEYSAATEAAAASSSHLCTVTYLLIKGVILLSPSLYSQRCALTVFSVVII
jgi:hypothetical protein